MIVEDVAEEIAQRIWTERGGMVLAVWLDGRVTVEGLGFYGYRQADQRWSVPLATFTTLGEVSSDEIQARIIEGLERHGIMV